MISFFRDSSYLFIGFSIFFNIFGLYSVLTFKKTHPILSEPEKQTLQPPLLSAAVLIPLRGNNEKTYKNLAAFHTQTYPPSEIRCGVDNLNDSAVPIIEQIQKDYPKIPTTLVSKNSLPNSPVFPNKKIQNLANLQKGANCDILIAVDQDISVPPYYLKDIVSHLLDPKTGMCTCLYRAAAPHSIGEIFELLTIHSDFFPSVLISEKLERGLGFAFGATMAFKQEVLKTIGGFESVGDYLADDHELGKKVKESGSKIALSGVIVQHNPEAASLKDYWTRAVRAARTHRFCRPAGYFFSIFSQGLPWIIPALFLSHLSRISLTLLAVWGITRILTAAASHIVLGGDKKNLAFFLFLPVHEAFKLIFWILAFTGSKVTWGETIYQVFKDGKFQSTAKAER